MGTFLNPIKKINKIEKNVLGCCGDFSVLNTPHLTASISIAMVPVSDEASRNEDEGDTMGNQWPPDALIAGEISFLQFGRGPKRSEPFFASLWNQPPQDTTQGGDWIWPTQMALHWEMMRWRRSCETCSSSHLTPPSSRRFYLHNRHITNAAGSVVQLRFPVDSASMILHDGHWVGVFGPFLSMTQPSGKFTSKGSHQKTTTIYGNKPFSTWWTWTQPIPIGDSCQVTTSLTHVDTRPSNSSPTRCKANGYGSHYRYHTTRATRHLTVASMLTSRTWVNTWGRTKHLDTTFGKPFNCEPLSWSRSMMQWWCAMSTLEEVPRRQNLKIMADMAADVRGAGVGCPCQQGLRRQVWKMGWLGWHRTSCSSRTCEAPDADSPRWRARKLKWMSSKFKRSVHNHNIW